MNLLPCNALTFQFPATLDLCETKQRNALQRLSPSHPHSPASILLYYVHYVEKKNITINQPRLASPIYTYPCLTREPPQEEHGSVECLLGATQPSTLRSLLASPATSSPP
jgi:hypothetical protein